MAQLGQAFNAHNVAPQQDFEAVPEGEYEVMIVASEMKPTKNMTGEYLQLEMEITQGDCKGRKLFDRLNLRNPNQQAVEIAQRTLSAICHATGVMEITNTEPLHHRSMLVRVKNETYQDRPQNRVAAYKPLSAGAAPTTQPQQPMQQPIQQQPVPSGAESSPPAPGSVPPWQRQ